MMLNVLRRSFPVALASLVFLIPASVMACPFCGQLSGPSLAKEVERASMVVVGKLENAKLSPDGVTNGTTDLVIEAVLKPHDYVKDKKKIVLERYVPIDKNTDKFLVFCDFYKDKLDPYRGIVVRKDSDIVKYLQGAVAVKDKETPERLKFFFDYLDNQDREIADDSYKEFAASDYKDYQAMAKNLDPDKIAKWLKDANTPAFRFGLYGSMLGHCGKEKHAKVLHDMLADPKHVNTSGIDGILAGYVLIKPKEGWKFLSDILGEGQKEFMQRYAALRAARFFIDSRPDVIDKNQVVTAVAQLLEQSDMADLAIEDFRKWGYDGRTDRILALYGQKSHDVPIVRRSIIRYALSFPKNARAAAFVSEVRKKDPETVKDIEELLDLEKGIPQPPKPAAK